MGVFRLKHHRPRLFVILFLLLGSAAFGGITFKLLARDTVLARLRSCPRKDLDRQEQLKAYFNEAGCSGTAMSWQKAERGKLGNVICTIKKKSAEEIVVGAHFDHADLGLGAVDNWSGTALLPSLYESLAAQPTKHTFVFVGFYGEEEGLVGSAEYVRRLDKERLASIDAMVNLDTFAQGPIQIWEGHADLGLEKHAVEVAHAMKQPLQLMHLENVSTDSESFRAKQVPSIEFCQITGPTLRLLHSVDDQVNRINPDDFYNAYHFLAAYLGYLDQVVPSREAQK
ncbi:MAG: M28 family peptidase [Acidobacteria bacterium]|nr:M28 family peptidase [Acidobacteriota bacterium]